MIEQHTRKLIKFFVGIEVEHTICFGKKTLFVVGIQPLDAILEQAAMHDCEHIYFGTSQSFNPKSMTTAEYRPWDEMIFGCMKQNLWVTLDFDVKHIEGIHESGYCENDKFIPMISVKLPYIKLCNYNTILKIDDNTWGDTNPGVWTHRLHDLQDNTKFTNWSQYTSDTIIE